MKKTMCASSSHRGPVICMNLFRSAFPMIIDTLVFPFISSRVADALNFLYLCSFQPTATRTTYRRQCWENTLCFSITIYYLRSDFRDDTDFHVPLSRCIEPEIVIASDPFLQKDRRDDRPVLLIYLEVKWPWFNWRFPSTESRVRNRINRN